MLKLHIAALLVLTMHQIQQVHIRGEYLDKPEYLNIMRPYYVHLITSLPVFVLAEVKNLFSQNIGKKPSLKITILKSTALYEFENYCWVQYQELQQTSETETVRTSTACIKVEDEKCYWVYLHETLVPSSS